LANRKSVSKASESETKSTAPDELAKSTSKPPDKNEQDFNKSFPIVGLGASAGGLLAFKQLLTQLPVDTGMAFVLVAQLGSKYETILPELLARATQIPVSEVQDGTFVVPDHIYVIPRNMSMAIEGGVLRLRPRQEGGGRHRPIDSFLQSLAEDQGHRAIGIILSGTTSDGKVGLQAIKAGGGITFAQDPQSAKYDSMPHSAITAGHVDFILTPGGIAQELRRISRHPSVTPIQKEVISIGQNGFLKILMLLRKIKGVDFTDYKANTLRRRITRRVVLNKLESMEGYARLLHKNAAEVEALYQDILINVTSFFRDPETFAVLKEKIFPYLVKHRTPDEPIRIWTLGCSTGQESYSLAIAFSEFVGDQSEQIPIQIFATDLNERAIEKARAGLYSKDIADDLSPERLRRFFTEADGGYQVSKPLRDMVVFAKQNVLVDPPFSRMDLISCRNLLIYLEPVLQKQILPLLHFALKPTGVLWLGSSETVSAASDLFEPQDKRHRFYSRKPAAERPRLRYRMVAEARKKERHHSAVAQLVATAASVETDAQSEVDRIILARYTPASALINDELIVLQLRGDTTPYLEPSHGKATPNLLKLAREGLVLALRTSVAEARKDEGPVMKEGLEVRYGGVMSNVSLEVIPLKHPQSQERHFLVIFEVAEPTDRGGGRKAGGGRRKSEGQRIRQLQQELVAGRDYLQSVVEAYEAASKELQSANEEAQSSNEELQSINEELETAKEELESSNEELTTLNEELNNRNTELGRLNSDLTNLFGSVHIPILILDGRLHLYRFTPAAEKLLNLTQTDVGRSISELKLNNDYPNLAQLIEEAIDTVSVKEREVQDGAGRWHLLRVRPYQTLDNKIDGAVVAFLDVDALKQNEQEVKAQLDYAEAILRTARDPLVVLDADLRVEKANDAFYKTFKVAPDLTEGRLIYDLGNRQWDIPKLRQLLEEIIPRNSFFDDYEVTHEFQTIGKRTMVLNARPLNNPKLGLERVLLGINDVTDRLEARAALKASELRYRRLFEEARDGILLLDPVSRRIVDANPFITQLLGYTREEFLGKELWQFGLIENEQASHAAFRELQNRGHFRYVDLTLRTKDGGAVEAQFVAALYFEDGKQTLQCNIRDISEQKRAEAAQAHLASIVESSDDAIVSKTLQGIITSWNKGAERLFGYAAAEIRGLPINTLIPPDRQEEEVQILERLGRGERIEHYETVRVKKDGTPIDVSLTISPIRDSSGQIIGASKVARDIGDRKRAEMEREESLRRESEARAEAEKANRIKDEFISIVSHELRTPLNAMLGWLQILRSGNLEEADVAPALEAIERNAKAQNQLVDDLLDTSRILMGKLRFEQNPVDLIEMIEAALEAVRPTAEAKGVELRQELDPTAGSVLGDVDRLKQIVWNLLSNAIKFTDQGGYVETRLEREGAAVAIIVRDTGEGISPEFLPHIFAPFRQADATTTRRHGGLGIGLAIVRHLVEAHGGQVGASSEGAGQGATIKVVLPLTTAADFDPKEKDKDEAEQPPLLTGLRVLLVDDNLDARMLFSMAFDKHGAEVKVGATVREALDILKQWQPDVLVSDIGMPGEDGYDLIRQVRSLPDDRGGQIPAVAVTGFASTKDAASILAAGYQVFVTKPIDLRELMVIIRSLTKNFI
jgi:two-component system, chemotaxis family, CheB/CheR fusion protein